MSNNINVYECLGCGHVRPIHTGGARARGACPDCEEVTNWELRDDIETGDLRKRKPSDFLQ